MPLIDKGTTEFSLGAMIESASDSGTVNGTSAGTTSTTTTDVNGSVGYFLDKHSQVGAFADVTTVTVSPPTGSSTSAGFTYLEGFYKYHFRLENSPEWVPYVGGYLGLLTVTLTTAGTSSTGAGTSFAGAAGVKYFFSERISMNLEDHIGFASYSITVAGTSVTESRSSNTLLFSLSVYFG